MVDGSTRPVGRPIRVAIVTNIPTPYRIPVYDLLAAAEGFDIRVFYFAEREFNRAWQLEAPEATSIVVPARALHWRGRDIHFGTGVWSELQRFRPDVVVTNGFNPALVIAFVWAVLHRAAHVAQTDGTPDLERRLSAVHRVVRRIVSRRSATTVAASRAGLDLLVQWGARPGTRFTSALAVDNAVFAVEPDAARDVDVLLSGHLNERKDPLFGLRVALRAGERLGRRVTVALLGDGTLRPEVEAFAAAHAAALDVRIAGFVQQAELPGWYGRSRVFVFPSHEDAWGLVVNEASAAAVPSIVAETVGAKELVEDGVSGFVLPHDEGRWADALVLLLGDESARSAMGAAAVERVAAYTFVAAAEGLEQAIRAARA